LCYNLAYGEEIQGAGQAGEAGEESETGEAGEAGG
jgi:hypothetical protein